MADSEKNRTDPRWDIVNELYDWCDKGVVDIGEKNNMNFVEISMALHMLNKKIEYEQFKAMFEFNVEEMKHEQDKPSPDLYK
tara:strand:- start:116 stop:361 length:246 start_codon:yes stop_codon:yes gene_type:complete